MILAYDNRSSSESDEDDICTWSAKKRKKNHDQNKVNISTLQTVHSENIEKDKRNEPDLTNQCKKFDELKSKFTDIRTFSALRSQRVEERKSKRLVKKALRDPAIKKAVENLGNASASESVASGNEEVKWDDIKPLLTVNDHLQGPVSHGDFGPKTELEYLIEDAIKEGDFEKAELLSDTLANREFAVKISKAFAAKKCLDKMQEQAAIEKERRLKKIRWTFDAKERWQMKGNM